MSYMSSHSLPHHMPVPTHSQSLPTSAHGPLDRLPANSTLLTPLPGYEPPLLPPLNAQHQQQQQQQQQRGGDVAYSGEAYEGVYEEEGTRPGTGGRQEY
jgi:hypothetical protein